ncbi:Nucleotide-binding, alpha-beta plait [Corchorus capsularis]|uniref:Large ribosomal subunit protein uL23m n=1 Tax=Corchorus capsularis TaxID=210143 RepID=A0A1R3GD94_COCAP|nr:Nucleotide-binding, alpha-beta plait [Corchorus capsularis]
MGSRLGRRVVHFANLPIKLLMPNTFTNIQEIALKTIPSASKIEIKRVLESLYGFDVEKVRTLNMEGKKKKRGGLLIAKPDYKKAYVTLRTPLSISENLFPIKVIQEEKESINKNSKNKTVVEEGEKKKHWLDEKMKDGGADKGKGKGSYASGRGGNGSGKGSYAPVRGGNGSGGEVKFPWSSMRRAS